MLKKLLIPNMMLSIFFANSCAPAVGAGVSNGSQKTIQGSVSQNEMIDNLKMSPSQERILKDVESKLQDKMDERKALEKMLNFDKPKEP